MLQEAPPETGNFPAYLSPLLKRCPEGHVWLGRSEKCLKCSGETPAISEEALRRRNRSGSSYFGEVVSGGMLGDSYSTRRRTKMRPEY